MNYDNDIESSNQSDADDDTYEKLFLNRKLPVVMAISNSIKTKVVTRRVKSSKPTRRGFYDH